MVANWKQACKDGVELTAIDNLLYAIMRGKNWTKCFSPIKNPGKLQSVNAGPYTAYFDAYWGIQYGRYNKSIFGNVNINRIKEYLPNCLPDDGCASEDAYIGEVSA